MNLYWEDSPERESRAGLVHAAETAGRLEHSDVGLREWAGRVARFLPRVTYGEPFLDVLQQRHICDPENRLRLGLSVCARGRGRDRRDIKDIYINMRSQFQ